MEAAVSGMWSDCLARFDAMDQSAAILITTLASGEDELGGDSKLEDKGGGGLRGASLGNVAPGTRMVRLKQGTMSLLACAWVHIARTG